jgi:hypothetical protein
MSRSGVTASPYNLERTRIRWGSEWLDLEHSGFSVTPNRLSSDQIEDKPGKQASADKPLAELPAPVIAAW